MIYEYEEKLRKTMSAILATGCKPKKIVIYNRRFECCGVPVEFVPYKRGDAEIAIFFDDEVEE